MAQGIQSLPDHKHPVKFRLNLRMADAGETDLIFNVAVAAAVQGKMADKAQQIGQLTFPKKFPLPLPDKTQSPAKKIRRGFPVHAVSQIIYRIGRQGFIVKQNVRPVETYEIQSLMSADQFPGLLRQSFENFFSKYKMRVRRRHGNSPF